MKYVASKPITLAAFQTILGTKSSIEISQALVDLVHTLDDRHELENICLAMFQHEDSDLHLTALLCLGHIARRFAEISVHKILPTLMQANNDQKLKFRLEDTLSDIEIFTGHTILF